MFIERERDIDTYVCMCIYIYIYILLPDLMSLKTELAAALEKAKHRPPPPLESSSDEAGRLMLSLSHNTS